MLASAWSCCDFRKYHFAPTQSVQCCRDKSKLWRCHAHETASPIEYGTHVINTYFLFCCVCFVHANVGVFIGIRKTRWGHRFLLPPACSFRALSSFCYIRVVACPERSLQPLFLLQWHAVASPEWVLRAKSCSSMGCFCVSRSNSENGFVFQLRAFICRERPFQARSCFSTACLCMSSAIARRKRQLRARSFSSKACRCMSRTAISSM